MATIVENRETGERFVMLGTGFGMYHATRPHWFFGEMGRTSESGSESLICVSNGRGEVGWLDSRDAVVVSVDGMPPSTILAGGGGDYDAPRPRS